MKEKLHQQNIKYLLQKIKCAKHIETADINIKIYQGEHKHVKDNCLLGFFNVKLTELKPKAIAKICITTGINADGILTVTAIDSNNNKNSLDIQTIRNDNIEKYGTILPHEVYEEEYDIYNKLYSNIKQQILFQLEENIYLKLNLDDKQSQLTKFNEYDNKIEKVLNTYKVTKTIEILEKNLLDVKNIILNVQHDFSMYLNNYIIESNTTINYMEKIEELISNIKTYNLLENQENMILELCEQIITLDNKDCDLLYIKIGEILGFNF